MDPVPSSVFPGYSLPGTSLTVSPTQTTTYTLTAVNLLDPSGFAATAAPIGQKVTKQVTVTVGSTTAGGGTGGTGGTGGNGGGSGTSSSLIVGVRVWLCVTGLQKYSANGAWLTMPAPLSGLDVKLYYDTFWGTADMVFRNRYNGTINFSSRTYAAAPTPPPTNGRGSLSAGKSETPPGPTLGVSVGLGGNACVVVDAVRFGADSGPYYNP